MDETFDSLLDHLLTRNPNKCEHIWVCRELRDVSCGRPLRMILVDNTLAYTLRLQDSVRNPILELSTRCARM